MNITLTTSTPSQIETECLVVTVIDASERSENGEKEEPKPQLLTDDNAVFQAAADLIASAEVTGKAMETTLLHKPSGLKAKRLLLVGAGKSKNFGPSELLKIAGAAVRSIKGKDLKTFGIVSHPGAAFSAEDSAKAIVEGAYVGSF